MVWGGGGYFVYRHFEGVPLYSGRLRNPLGGSDGFLSRPAGSSVGIEMTGYDEVPNIFTFHSAARSPG